MSTTVGGVGSATQVKRGLKALLLGPAYAAQLTDLEAAFGDGLPMTPLRTVTRAETRELAELNYAELVLVQSTPMGAGGEGDWGGAYEHVIAVRFYVGGDDEEVITDQAERYVLATRRLFLTPGNEVAVFPFLGGTVGCGREDYDPIAKHQATGALVKVGTIELIVRAVE